MHLSRINANTLRGEKDNMDSVSIEYMHRPSFVMRGPIDLETRHKLDEGV